jgi:MoxR-like ATPase
MLSSKQIVKGGINDPQSNDFAILLERSQKMIEESKWEIQKVIKGQSKLVNTIIRALLCRGHVLMEGLPGLGKTVLCRTFARIAELDFKRVQFTTDLLPSDIIGITTFDKKYGTEIIKGPIFCNFLLADEINRAPPKVQSALLEAMGERQVTIGKTTHNLENPFLVLATQNPIEQSGTFPLPEAQLDRFLFKVDVSYPDYDAEFQIMQENLNNMTLDDFDIIPKLSQNDIIDMQALIKDIHVEWKLKEYILNIIRGTRNPYELNIEHASFITIGASPRATINLLLAAKAEALMNGRYYVVPQDIKMVVHEILRQRIYLSFQSKMANINTDKIIDEILDKISIY